jgi:hypothetical protein
MDIEINMYDVLKKLFRKFKHHDEIWGAKAMRERAKINNGGFFSQDDLHAYFNLFCDLKLNTYNDDSLKPLFYFENSKLGFFYTKRKREEIHKVFAITCSSHIHSARTKIKRDPSVTIYVYFRPRTILNIHNLAVFKLTKSKNYSYEYPKIGIKENIISTQNLDFEYTYNSSVQINFNDLENQFNEDYISEINSIIDQKVEDKRNQELKKQQALKLKRKEDLEKGKIANQKIRAFKLVKKKLLKELDSKCNDTLNSYVDDFMKLLKKHQKTILEVDKKHITELVKLDNFLKLCKQNIINSLSIGNEAQNKTQLNKFKSTINQSLKTYQVFLVHSLNMITSLTEGDLITYNEIYLSFDRMKVFNSEWQNEISNTFSNLSKDMKSMSSDVKSLSYDIKNMNYNISTRLDLLASNVRSMEIGLTSELYNLSYDIKSFSSNVSRELDSINSGIKFNNLLSVVTAVQLAGTKKRLK